MCGDSTDVEFDASRIDVGVVVVAVV